MSKETEVDHILLWPSLCGPPSQTQTHMFDKILWNLAADHVSKKWSGFGQIYVNIAQLFLTPFSCVCVHACTHACTNSSLLQAISWEFLMNEKTV